MATKANETTLYPFTAFNFSIEINVPGVATQVCSAAFSECDGLEMTMDVKTIREGGNNGKQIRFTGPLNYGQLTLKRGLTENFDLWHWVSKTQENPSLRADAEVVLLAAGRQNQNTPSERVRFKLSRCLPLKLKAPALNARDGMVAIEEFQLAYESLTVKQADREIGF